jgi:hypothetical protein
MKKHKKFIIVAIIAVAVIGAALGAVAFAQADDQSATTPTTTSSTPTLLDRVATIYEQNTGTPIIASELQKAFTTAEQQAAFDKLDAYLQKLVDANKITAQQKQDYETWYNNRPTQALTDEYKQWLQSTPQIPGLNSKGGMGIPGGGPAMRFKVLPRRLMPGFGPGFGIN